MMSLFQQAFHFVPRRNSRSGAGTGDGDGRSGRSGAQALCRRLPLAAARQIVAAEGIPRARGIHRAHGKAGLIIALAAQPGRYAPTAQRQDDLRLRIPAAQRVKDRVAVLFFRHSSQ